MRFELAVLFGSFWITHIGLGSLTAALVVGRPILPSAIMLVGGLILLTTITLVRCSRRPESLWQTLAAPAFGLLGSFGALCVTSFSSHAIPVVLVMTFVVVLALVASLHFPLQARLARQPESF